MVDIFIIIKRSSKRGNNCRKFILLMNLDKYPDIIKLSLISRYLRKFLQFNLIKHRKMTPNEKKIISKLL